MRVPIAVPALQRSFRIHATSPVKGRSPTEQAPFVRCSSQAEYLSKGPVFQDARQDGVAACSPREVADNSPWCDAVGGTHHRVYLLQERSHFSRVPNDILHVGTDIQCRPSGLQHVLQRVGLEAAHLTVTQHVSDCVVPEQAVRVK
jgi:hypothetical protein